MSKLVTDMEKYRNKLGLSQEQLAEKTDCRRETIVRLERGMYNPSLKLAHDIAKVFEVPIEEVFHFVEDDLN